MHGWSKFGLMLVLILALPACGPLRVISPAPGLIPQRDTPSFPPSAPVTVSLDASIPTPTPISARTLEPTPKAEVTFDRNANAYRIRFAPNGTWVEFNDTVSANSPKHYILSASQGQVMSVSIPQGPPFSVRVTGVNGTPLNDASYPLPFWRGVLPSREDYIISIDSQVSEPFTLRIAINPPRQATQDFGFHDPRYLVALSYTDEFAPTNVQIPVNIKGTPLLTLAFVDSGFYTPRTNLSEAYLQLVASKDPTIVSTCTLPSSQAAEIVTGQRMVNGLIFTRSEFGGVAAGNWYEQVAYRAVRDGTCYEVVTLIHSTNIGNYPAGTVVEFDRAGLERKFEAVLNTFLAK